MKMSLSFFYMCLATFFFAGMNTLIRQMRLEVSTYTIVSVRMCVQLLILLPVVLFMGRRHLLHHLIFDKYMMLRSFLGTLAMVSIFTSLTFAPAGFVSLLLSTSLIWSLLLSTFFLREKVTPMMLCFIAITLIGFFVASSHSQKNWEFQHWGIVFALLGALSKASAYVLVKKLTKTFESQEIVFVFAFWGSVMSLGYLITSGVEPVVWSDRILMMKLLGSALCGVLGGYFLTVAFKYGTAIITTAATQMSTFFTVILGVVFLNEIPTVSFYVGFGMVLIGLFLLYFQEVRRQKKATQLPSFVSN